VSRYDSRVLLRIVILDVPVLAWLARRLLASALRRPAAPERRQGHGYVRRH
jgi:hypothetical protein